MFGGGMILQGIGAGMSGIGGTMSTIGNHKAANKSRKDRINGLVGAKNEFDLGSTDTQGNRLNFNHDRGWGFDLSRAGKAEAQNANRTSYLANAMSARMPSAGRNQLTAMDYKAAQQQANANQSAASKMGLRTASNLGNLAASTGMVGSDYLRQAMANNLRNGANYNQQLTNQYLTNANNAKNLTAQTMQNLLNIQNGPATQQLALNQAIAEAQAVPARNWLQTGGQIMSGLGQGVANFGSGMQKQANLEKQQLIDQQNFEKYLGLLKSLMGGAG